MRSSLWWLIRTILQQNIIYCNTLLCLMQGESKQGCRELKSIAFSSPQRYQLVSNYLFVVFIVNPNNSKVVNAPREKMKLHIQFILQGNKLPGRKGDLFAFLRWSRCHPVGWSCLLPAPWGLGITPQPHKWSFIGAQLARAAWKPHPLSLCWGAGAIWGSLGDRAVPQVMLKCWGGDTAPCDAQTSVPGTGITTSGALAVCLCQQTSGSQGEGFLHSSV